MVKVGDTLPSVGLHEGSPLNEKVDINTVLKNGYLVGIPAAFSPTCKQGHIPKYITKASSGDIKGQVVVISINDAFAMAAFQEALDPGAKSGVRFLADPTGEFTKQLDLLIDTEEIFGNKRSNRYAITVKDGKVEKIEVEPDWTKVDVSSADKIV